jgi:hypothetical protein
MTAIVATQFPQTHTGLNRLQTGFGRLGAWARIAYEGLLAARQRRADRLVEEQLMRFAQSDPRLLADLRAMQTRHEV